MAASTYDYRLFGLRVQSEISLPELVPLAAEGSPEVSIRIASVAEPPQERDGLHVVDGELILVVSGTARYRICAGSEITVDAEENAPERNVRLYLLGSAFGALIHQRGLLPLHANAVEVDGRAIAFMGESGAGKSTLAAWFHDRGHRVIADDVCVVDFARGKGAVIVPGLPRLRLWQEALEHTGRDPSDFPRSYTGDETWKKYDVSIADQTTDAEVELQAIYLLRRDQQFNVERLHGIEAADAIFANTYRGAFLSALQGQKAHWTSATRLLRSVPVYALNRAWGLDQLDDQGTRILNMLEELPEARQIAAAP